MKNIKQSIVAAAAILLMSACSKSSPSPTSGGLTSHTVKFTVTVVGSVSTTNQGLIDLVFNSASPGNSTIWSVNSVQQPNQTLLTFDGGKFPQGATTTYIIQSLVPVTDTKVHLDFGNSTNLPAYSISYKAEIDGKVQNDDENVTINGTANYEHDYTY